MRYLFTILCVFSLHIGIPGFLMAENEPSENEGIVILLDEKEIEERYDHLPELVIRVKEANFDDSIQVLYFDKTRDELVEIHEEWKKEEVIENDVTRTEGEKTEKKIIEYVLRWKFTQEMEDTYIVVKNKDSIHAQSSMFTIFYPLKEPLFYVDEEVLDKEHSYTYDKNIQIRVLFPAQMKKDETRISWRGKKLNLQWDDAGESAVFTIEEEGEDVLTYAWKDIQGHELTGESEFRILMDQSAPNVQLYFNDEPIKDISQKRYAHNVHVKMVVKDTSFDPDNSELLINQKAQQNEWKQKDSIYTSEFVLEDGNYTLSYVIGDKLQHQTKSATHSFQIDTKAPKISLELKNALNSTQQLIHLDVQDASLDETQTVLYIVHDGTEERLHPSCIQKEDVLSCNVAWKQEGSYEVYAVSKDLMNHTSSSSRVLFVIDRTPPVLTLKLNQKIQQANSQYLTNRSVRVDAGVQDATLSEKKLALYKNGKLLFQKQEWEVFEILPGSMKNDDYELVLFGLDQAGNQNEQHFQFAIHTNMNSLHIANDIFHGLPSSNNWRPQIVDEKEYQIVQAILRKNHELVDFHWGDGISEEGVYTLEVMAEDKAGNRRWLEPSFSFIIDKTPPDIKLIHENLQQELRDKVKVHETFLLVIEPYDSYLQKQGKFTYIRVNGNAIHVPKDKHTPLRFDEAGEYLIEAGVIDDAGNKADYNWVIQVSEEEVKYQPIQRPVILTDKKKPHRKDVSYGPVSAIGISVMMVLAGSFYYVRKRKN